MAIPGLKLAASVFLAAAFVLPAFGITPDANTAVPRSPNAVPGSPNYVEGQVLLGTQVLDSTSIGTAQLKSGDSLSTENGKTEVLLAPGVILRVGVDSSVRMISASLSDMVVAVDKGHAMIEVAKFFQASQIRIIEDGATARLLKTGLYDFDLRHDQVRVFDGEAKVEDARSYHHRKTRPWVGPCGQPPEGPQVQSAGL
jgi:hypothetical protein